MPLRRVDSEASGRAQQNRFQLHMAGFAGSAPKGSSGRELSCYSFARGLGVTPPHTPPRQGVFHRPVGTIVGGSASSGAGFCSWDRGFLSLTAVSLENHREGWADVQSSRVSLERFRARKYLSPWATALLASPRAVL